MTTMLQAKKYRKKPVEIDAIQWDGSEQSYYAVLNFTVGKFQRVEDAEAPNTAKVYDSLHNTWVELYQGDWIIRGVKGEFYPCNDAVFKETYEPPAVMRKVG